MADTKLSALTALAAQPADNDEVYIRDVSEAAAAESKRITIANLLAGAGGAADFPEKVKPNVTRWVIPGWYVGSGTSFAATANRIYYIPIFVEETTTYIRIAVKVSTSDAGSADLRIFNWVNGLPDSLVLSAGTVNTGSTGVKEITISQELTRGYYFLAVRYSGAPSLSSALSANAVPPVAGIVSTANPVPIRVILAVDAAYADPAPTPTLVDDSRWCWIVLREN